MATEMSDNFRGAALMMASMAGFVINDAFMRAVLGDVPLFQAIFLRGIFLCLFLLVLTWQRGHLRCRPSPRDTARISARAIAELVGTLFFLTALTRMPFANISAVLQFLPLSVTLAAALFLGYPVGWRRVLAILMGFAGVLLIVKPDADGFDLSALLAICAVLAVTIRDIVIRNLSPDIPSAFVALVAATVVTTVCGICAAFGTWVPVTFWQFAFMIAAASVLVVGYIASVAAMRVGDIAFVSPFRYTALVWALAIGILAFKEYPDGLALLGASLIVGMGLFSFYREHRQTRSR